jgi:hypothetical protein
VGFGNRVGLGPSIHLSRRYVDKSADPGYPAGIQQGSCPLHMHANIFLSHFEGTLYGGGASSVNYQIKAGN